MKTTLVALLALAGTGAAAAPAHLDALDREMRIFEKVFTADLRETAGSQVHDVDVHYLAEQGVLIALSLRRGWFGSYHRVVEIDAAGEASLAMPTMVREILTDLQIPFGPLDAEERAGLGDERRELRREMRDLRAKIRAQRRKQPLDAEGEAELERLRGELEALEAEREALRSELRDQYAQVHILRGDADDERDDSDAADFDATLVGAVCDYAGTLKSLPKDERLTVQVRRRGEHAFHVFEFKDVLRCANEALTPAELHEAAIVYRNERPRGERHRGAWHQKVRHHHGRGHGGRGHHRRWRHGEGRHEEPHDEQTPAAATRE